MTGKSRLQRRPRNTAEAIRYQESKHHPALRRESKKDQPDTIHQQPDIDTPVVSQFWIHHSYQPHLHSSNQQSYHGKGIANHLIAPMKAKLCKEIPIGLYSLRGKIYQEERNSQSAN